VKKHYRLIIVTERGNTLRSEPMELAEEQHEEAEALIGKVAMGNLDNLTFNWEGGRVAIPSRSIHYLALLPYNPEDDA
jgi:hypothetical protein